VSGKLLDGDLGVRPSTELVRRMGTWHGNKHVNLELLFFNQQSTALQADSQ
jgi:hypothetical protein